MTIIVTGGAGFIGANFIYYQLNISVVEETMLWLSDLKGGDQNAERT